MKVYAYSPIYGRLEAPTDVTVDLQVPNGDVTIEAKSHADIDETIDIALQLDVFGTDACVVFLAGDGRQTQYFGSNCGNDVQAKPLSTRPGKALTLM